MEILRTFSELSQADEPQIAQNQVLRAPGPGKKGTDRQVTHSSELEGGASGIHLLLSFYLRGETAQDRKALTMAP